MLGFVGQFQHTLDVKGRLILPSKFRIEFERGGHLSPATEGCVALWTPGEFSRQTEEWLQLSRVGGAPARQQMRYWASNSSSVEFDKQGRFALPISIRDYGQLSRRRARSGRDRPRGAMESRNVRGEGERR